MHVVTFGEVMLRMAPEEFLRIPQALPGRLEVTFGGGEVNVAVSIARQGGRALFLTSLPDNPLTDAFAAELRKFNVGTELIRRCDRGRFGVYYVETGANQRAGTVTYDRDHSSISLTAADEYDWDAAFAAANWFHITGITPAISASAAAASLAAVEHAKQRGLTVSCDLNFRKKLWNWKPGLSTTELAQQTMQGLMPYVDVVIANEEDADKTLGIARRTRMWRRGRSIWRPMKGSRGGSSRNSLMSPAWPSRSAKASPPATITGAPCCSTSRKTAVLRHHWMTTETTALTKSAISSTGSEPAIPLRGP